MLGCGQGTELVLLEVQPAGKRAMSAVDWFRGLNEKVKLD
jgi:methionyl-tRNA formyltransferase